MEKIPVIYFKKTTTFITSFYQEIGGKIMLGFISKEKNDGSVKELVDIFNEKDLNDESAYEEPLPFMLASTLKRQLRELKAMGRSKEMIQICHCSNLNEEQEQDVSLVLRLNKDENVFIMLDYYIK